MKIKDRSNWTTLYRILILPCYEIDSLNLKWDKFFKERHKLNEMELTWLSKNLTRNPKKTEIEGRLKKTKEQQ